MSCIYRKSRTLELCKKHVAGIHEKYCKTHKKQSNLLYEIYDDIFHDKVIIDAQDLYSILDHIYNCINFTNDESTNDANKRLFFEMLKLFSKDRLKYFYEKLYLCIIINDTYNKNSLIYDIYALLYNTHIMKQNHVSKIKIIQRKYRNHLYNNLSVKLDDIHVPVNSEDIFTYDNIDEIPKERLFVFYDDNCLYAFDAIELEYYVRKCREDLSDVCNPYTKNIISDKIIAKLDLFIKHNNLIKKSNEYMWITDLHAYTDLALEIERNGFYNSPDWYMKFNRRLLINIIKFFKDFSMSVQESQNYFRDFFSTHDTESIVFKFCRESIRLFKECNEDKYILCCNFMKALAMCSIDFYNNLPNWLAGTFTRSNIMHNTFLNNNFLFYYYVEYLE
jgi:hypothetical protein